MCKSNPDPCVKYLDELSVELVAMGVKCELLTTGTAPRLRLHIPWIYVNEDDEFQDNIVASSKPDGTWRFWWPWAHPIAPVNDIPRAVDHIYGTVPGMWDEENEEVSPDGSASENQPQSGRPEHAPGVAGARGGIMSG